MSQVYQYLKNWSPSTNAAHAIEAMMKAKWGTVNFDCWRVICTIEGHKGKSLLSETNGNKGEAMALAACRAIVAALQAAEKAKG